MWELTLDLSTVSGGFAVVQPNSSLSVNAVEAYPLEDFSAESVRAQIAEAQKVASGSGSEQDIAEAKIELEASCSHHFSIIQDSFANLITGFGEPAGFPEIEGITSLRLCSLSKETLMSILQPIEAEQATHCAF